MIMMLIMGDHNCCVDGDDDCVCDYSGYRLAMSQTQSFNCATHSVLNLQSGGGKEEL